MCLFLESIKVEKGRCLNIERHNRRFRDTRNRFFRLTGETDLSHFLPPVPDRDSIYKFRVVYGKEIEEVSLSPYAPKKIGKVRLVEADPIDYRHKFADRKTFDELLKGSPGFDDIIVVQDGFIADSSYANLLFYRDNDMYTPDTPLLNGTKRQWLLEEGLIHEIPVRVKDLQKFSHFGLINAMLDPGEIKLPIDAIHT